MVATLVLELLYVTGRLLDAVAVRINDASPKVFVNDGAKLLMVWFAGITVCA
jgi:hypothetical protein